METKVCTKCNEEKCLSEFKKTKEKYSSKSNICISFYFKQYRENNKEKRKKHALNYYIRNKEIVKERSKLRSIKIKDDEIEIEKSRIRRKIYRENNKEIIRIKRKEYKEKNKDILKEKSKIYCSKNRDKINERTRKYHNERCSIDPTYKLKNRIKNLISTSIKKMGYKKNTRTYKILGCTYDEFKLHIESKFEEWMNWDNYGRYNGEEKYGWDLDHIIPLSSVTTEEDIIRLNHYSNIQPLCSYINRYVKRDKIV